MNIEQLGVRITGVPGIQSIEVTARGSIVIDCDFTYSDIDGKIVPQSYGLPQAIELRDALTAAIEHAERMSGAPAGSDECAYHAMGKPCSDGRHSFTVGQELTGAEDLPVGTVIRDGDNNAALGFWRRIEVKESGWALVLDDLGRHGTVDNSLQQIVTECGGATIVSLP